MLRLAEHPNIIGVKECTSLANMAYLIEHKPEEFLIYTGEDGDAFRCYEPWCRRSYICCFSYQW